MPVEITFAVTAMLDTVVFRRIRAAARRFVGANEGNIAILFGIAVIPIISFVGAAVDYTRASSARSSMQAALDSTALMLAKDLTEGTITTSQISAKADAYFRALYTNAEAKSVAITATYTQNSGNGSTILINGTGDIETGFMRVVGFPDDGFQYQRHLGLGQRPHARRDGARRHGIDGRERQDAERCRRPPRPWSTSSAHSPKNPGDIYISMVPFAKDVNLGGSYYNSTWIDWSVWDSQSYTKTWGTCSKACYTDRTTCKNNGKTWTRDKTKWTGCVTDRTQDYDTKNTTPTSTNAPTMVVAEEYVSGSTSYCKTGSSNYVGQIVPLSYDWSSIKTAIDAL